jgi:hypothetical protein
MSEPQSQWTGVRLFDTPVPVLAAKHKPDGGIEAPKPMIYGTAFPILAGLFLTASHVFQAAEADGIPLSKLRSAAQKTHRRWRCRGYQSVARNQDRSA